MGSMSQLQIAGPQDDLPPRSLVIGLYGISGSGKSYLLDKLKQELGDDDFIFYEGSETIASRVPGGLDAFQKYDEETKQFWRMDAINHISFDSSKRRRSAIVTGHFAFWSEGDEACKVVCNDRDMHVFTHIIYLDVPADIVSQRIRTDPTRLRTPASAAHLQKWQEEEKNQLRILCRNHKILFIPVSYQTLLLEKLSALIRDFIGHTEEKNLSHAIDALDETCFGDPYSRLETVLVLDADKTLAPNDTGAMFWEKASSSKHQTLKTLFDSQLQYSYTAFRQATLLYEEHFNDQAFDTICEAVASEVTMYLDVVSLLQRIASESHVRAVVVTSSLRRVWEKVLKREGVSTTVDLIGGGRLADGFVVTPEVKGAITSHLRKTHALCVWAFGDSPLDLLMLKAAHKAIVIVGEEHVRSKSMEAALAGAIDDGLDAQQALLPNHSSSRLNAAVLPVVRLTDRKFIDSILRRRSPNIGLHLLDATHKNAAKILMTATRDAGIAGPALREAHRQIGWYLAMQYLTEVIGLQGISIPHVQGGTTTGHHLYHERQTLIVALMRGGEPMALGVSDAFPLAMFLHAAKPDDVRPELLQECLTVVLVDSVVNSGRTLVHFIEHIRTINGTIQIVVVAGVVQAGSTRQGSLIQEAAEHERLTMVTLRISDNKYTGKGNTDTGHRLFNTTRLP